ncbi:hypothetical protein [Paenibacillus humicola]|uniref:hypothetical protein n=1 Tax=Paenibacillus humicola TaxID=3110540 RepID=UPI00237A6C5D|nr:hypothetical protein [Paenibacillus humicola]
MDKRKYYVSVQARTVLMNQGDAAYELEIEATPEDIRRLNDLFESVETFETQTYFRAQVPGLAYHHDSENDAYDEHLKLTYELLYELGTEETKAHIRSMNILGTTGAAAEEHPEGS